MKLKLLAVLMLCCVSISAWAQCPVQETTVLFVNGVWTGDDVAEEHSIVLKALLRNEGLSPECVHIDYSHTQDDGKFDDAIEVMVQKSLEDSVPFSDLVKIFFRATLETMTFTDVLARAYLNGVGEVIEAQTLRHLEKIREALNRGHRVIVVAHSQGNFYWNAVWTQLSVTEQLHTFAVGVSSPTLEILGGGSHTALSRDGVRNRFFVASVSEGVVINDTRFCEEETELTQNSWTCHGFATGYLFDPGSRNRIAVEVAALVPKVQQTATITGRTLRFAPGGSPVPESGVEVILIGGPNAEELASTTSDATGNYAFNIPECVFCAMAAQKGSLAGVTEVSFVEGETVAVDIIVGELVVN